MTSILFDNRPEEILEIELCTTLTEEEKPYHNLNGEILVREIQFASGLSISISRERPYLRGSQAILLSFC